MNAQEIRQSVTDQIVQALQSDEKPIWIRPWRNDANCGPAMNIVSRKLYRGINPLVMMISSIRNGFVSRFWGSYKQWGSLGGQVRRGSKGTSIVYYKTYDKPAEKDEKPERIFLLRHYYVFNLQQVDGSGLDQYRPGKETPVEAAEDWMEIAENAIADTKADIRLGGNKAFYSPAGDYIQIPARDQFLSSKDFYGTHFHELAHWSLVSHRLNVRESYAAEELVAELTSAFISWQLNIPQSEDLSNSRAYLQSWLKEMNGDSRFIFRAAATASKAADFILSFSEVEQKKADLVQAIWESGNGDV